MDKLYRNTMTGETRSYAGWKHWAISFYGSLTHDTIVKRIDVLMPNNWWERTQKVLRLEVVE